MSQLLVGLIGVIVGGLLGALSSWLLDVSRDRRHRRDKLESDARELRRAGRLVEEELYVNLRLLGDAVDDQRWWRHPHYSLRTTRWREYEPLFAGVEATDEVWNVLALAYEIIGDLNSSADERAGQPSAVFSPESDRELRMAIAAIDEGRRGLVKLSTKTVPPFEPDPVAAMFNAAMAAGNALLADESGAPPFEHRQELRVVADGPPVLGVALMYAPDWTPFPCKLPPGTKLTVVVQSIPGKNACVVSPLGDARRDSESARRFVPNEVRALEQYRNFALVLQFPGDRALVAPWEEGGA